MDFFQGMLLSLLILAGGIIGLISVSGKYRAGTAILIILLHSIITSFFAIKALSGTIQSFSFTFSWFSEGMARVRIDALSAWFILIINLISSAGALFGAGYLTSYKKLETNLALHWVFYVLFHASMLWVCMFDHGILFLIAWELMSVSSLMLVMFEYQKTDTVKAGINYMVQMHLSVLLLTTGILWIYGETGSFSLSALGQVSSASHSTWIVLLLFGGFAIKAGFVPFHTWLPHAHPASPSHVSGVMSGVIVKMGIYGIFRIIMGIRHDWFLMGEILIGLSVTTALFGIINAALKYDIKRSLAFCTIENIGIIGIGLGIGLMGLGMSNVSLILFGFGGALVHTLNHSLFKSLLFFSAGSVYQQTHTRNIEKLGGLVKSMPVTTGLFLTGALAIGGLPPLNGFVSEFLIYSGIFKGLGSVKGTGEMILLILSVAGLVLVGGISILAFTRLFGITFLGNPRTKLSHQPSEVSRLMLVPQILLVIIMLSIALFPRWYLARATQVIQGIFPAAPVYGFAESGNYLNIIQHTGQVAFVFLLLAGGIFLLRSRIVKGREPRQFETWGCGYTGNAPKTQYTGRSYARTFGNLLGLVAREQKNHPLKEPMTIFPAKQKFSTYYFDVIEQFIILPTAKRMTFILNYFKFVQNGRIQSYVLYGLFFIFLVFIGTIFGFIN